MSNQLVKGGRKTDSHLTICFYYIFLIAEGVSSAVKIKKIPFQKSPVKRFILFAWDINQKDTHWVPPLISDQQKLLNPMRNPFFQHSEAELWGAYQEGKMVGRIAVGVNHHSNQFRNEKVAFFGFFEAIHNQEVADLLFQKAAEWGKNKGMEILRGPFNLTINDEAGLLVDGFNTDPFIMMTHNPRYYPELIEKSGFSKAMDAYAYYTDARKHLSAPLLQMAKYIETTLHPKIRPFDTGKHFLKDAHTAMDMINESLARNWAAAPLTDKEIEFKAKDLKAALVPDLCFFVEIQGKTVGFSLTLPNYNEAIKKANGRLFPFGLFKILYYARKIKTARTIQLGMIKEYQKSGLGTYCYVEITKRAAQRGIHSGEMSWILENNKAMVNAAELLGGKRYKTYRWYEKRIN